MHSPGPWKVEEKRSFHNWNFFPISATSVDPSCTKVPRIQFEIATAGDKEDANLIAAAPDLLKALKELKQQAYMTMTGGHQHLIDNAQDAIDKAEGRI